MKDKIFVTGATGLIGSNLVKKLVTEGKKVKILKRKNSDHPFLKDLNVEIVEGDISDINILKRSMKDCFLAYHLAASLCFNKFDYNETYKTNVLGTRNVMTAAFESGVKKVVHASSIATIGRASSSIELMNEENHFPDEKKKPCYAYSKWLAEQEVIVTSKKGLNVSIANIAGVIGAGEKNLNMGLIIKTIYKLPVFMAPPGGTSVIAVDDVVSGLIAIAEKGQRGEKYILSGDNLSYLQIVNEISKVVKNSEIKKSLPKFTASLVIRLTKVLEILLSFLGMQSKLFTTEVMTNLFFNKYFDNSKAKKELGWKPKTSFRNAVKQAFDFYKEQQML